MVSTSTDEILVIIEERVMNILREYSGQELNSRVLYDINNRIMDMLGPYYHLGYMEEMPLVDLNHEVEIRYLDGEIERFQKLVKSGALQYDDVKTELATVISYRNSLAESITSTSLKAFFKNKNTLEPFRWEPRGKYDH